MSRIKSCITPRYSQYTYVSIDFSQLEIIGKALVTNDPMMKQDIRDGKDFHCIRGAMLAGIDYNTFHYLAIEKADPKYVKLRRAAKSFTFRRIYGASVKTIAESLGWRMQQVQRLIDREDERYAVAVQFFESLEDLIRINAYPTERVDAAGNQIYESKYSGPLGKEYTIQSKWDKYKKEMVFEKPKILNHIVQGFSTGDLTQVSNYCILKYLLGLDRLEEKDVIPILYTYDSNDFEILTATMDKHIGNIAKAMTTDVKQELLEDFRFDIDIPLRVEVEVGPNKNSLIKYKGYAG